MRVTLPIMYFMGVKHAWLPHTNNTLGGISLIQGCESIPATFFFYLVCNKGTMHNLVPGSLIFSTFHEKREGAWPGTRNHVNNVINNECGRLKPQNVSTKKLSNSLKEHQRRFRYGILASTMLSSLFRPLFLQPTLDEQLSW